MLQSMASQRVGHDSATELNFSNSSKKKKEERLPNSFYKTSITRIPKPDKDRTRKKLQADIPNESEKAMAPQSSTLAWKIPWREEPGRLQSMGLLRVTHD